MSEQTDKPAEAKVETPQPGALPDLSRLSAAELEEKLFAMGLAHARSRQPPIAIEGQYFEGFCSGMGWK